MMPDDDTGTYRDFLNDFQPGVFLGTRYKILKMIGAGGMGRVYMTHDLELDLDVALKVIRPELLQSERALDRLKNELILARKVSHKNVVRIHDIGEVNGLKYLTMTYIPGKSLRDVLRESGTLNVNRAIHIFLQICEGVAAAHEEGVLHRDLKPANVMLDETDRVYLTDFSIAKWLDAPDESATGVLIGTPAYLSPEQTWGERPDVRSDIYALGLILYELLTGELPFDQQKALAFKSRLPSDLPQKIRKAQPEIPSYLISMIQRCLDPSKTNRYQSVMAILNDLQNESVSGKSWVVRNAVLAGCILLAAMGGVFAFRVLHHPQIEPARKQSAPATARVIQSAVVLPFRNKTGKEDLSWIETAMGDLLITDLSQVPGLRVTNSDRVSRILEDLKISPGGYDDESARRIGELLDAGFVIQGNLTEAGSTYRMDVQVSDRTNAKNVFYLKATGNRQEDFLTMVDRISQQIQQKLQPYPEQRGGAANTVRTSIAGLKSFQQGVLYFRQQDYDHAISSFQECILTDPKFGEVYLKLARAYAQTGREDQAAGTLEKAIEIGAHGDEKTNATIQAEYALLKGDSQKAIEIYQAFGKTHSRDPDVLLTIAGAYEHAGDFKNAISTLQRVIELDPNQEEAFFQLGKDTILSGDPERAIRHYLIKALSMQTQMRNLQGQADVMNAMGVGYERLGRYDDALKYYKDSLSIKEAIGNKKSATTSLTNIAKLYIFQSRFDKAKTILDRALTVYEELKDQSGVADVQNTFGVICENQGQYANALKYYKNALQIRKELGDDRLTALSYDNIGQIYFLTARYDEAQAFTEQALALRKKIGDQNGIILSLQNLGFLQLAQGALDPALKTFLDALNQARSIQFENAIAVSLGNMATIYQNQGRYTAALDSYREAVDILEKLSDKKGQAEYVKLMGNVFLEMGRFPEAHRQLEIAKRMAEEIDSDEILTDVSVLLARLSRLEGDASQAQKSVDEATQTASKDGYQKGLLGAKIEKGLLTQSDSILKSVSKEATTLGDVWLKIASQYALASIYLRNDQARKAIQVCEQGIPSVTKMELTPYLYRFHSIEGQAYAKLNERQQMAEHFQQASTYIEKIRKELKSQYLSSFLGLPEVRAALSQ